MFKKWMLLLFVLPILVGCHLDGNKGMTRSLNRVANAEYQAFNDEDYLSRLNAFSSNLYPLVKEENNYAYSPLSIYFAFSLLHFVGDQNVKDEVEEFMGMTSSDIEKSGSLFKSLNKEVYWENKLISRLQLTNSIWLDSETIYHQEPLDEMAEKYYTWAFSTPFASNNKKANNDIRKFIAKYTQGLIDKDFDLNPDTIMALINTLYIKDVWGVTADLSEKPGIFYGKQKEKETSFLYGNYVSGVCQENDVSEYFYTRTSQGYRLKFILPKEGYTLDEAMSASNLYVVNANTDYGDTASNRTRCIFPKFKITCDTPLKDILQDNNYLNQTFTSFKSNIVDDDLFVSDIKHSTVLNVNEKGVEGAAVTIIEVAKSSIEVVKNHDFLINRPFGFVLTSPNNVVLFAGQVTDI